MRAHSFLIFSVCKDWLGLLGLNALATARAYRDGEMMMMTCWFHWWRKSEYPEETTNLQQVTDETFTVCKDHVICKCGVTAA